jgi:hypothetical protein
MICRIAPDVVLPPRKPARPRARVAPDGRTLARKDGFRSQNAREDVHRRIRLRRGAERRPNPPRGSIHPGRDATGLTARPSSAVEQKYSNYTILRYTLRAAAHGPSLTTSSLPRGSVRPDCSLRQTPSTLKCTGPPAGRGRSRKCQVLRSKPARPRARDAPNDETCPIREPARVCRT